MGIDLLKRRRDLLNAKHEATIPLPDGYTLGQYFDITSDVVCSFTVQVPRTIEALIEPNVTRGQNYILGRAGHFPVGNNSKKALAASNSSGSNFFDADTPALIKCYQASSSSSCKYWVDGVDTGLTGTCGHGNLGIFGQSSNYSTNYRGKVYWVKIYKSGNLIHHLIPVKDSNGNGKVYNLVTKSFVSPTTGTINVV